MKINIYIIIGITCLIQSCKKDVAEIGGAIGSIAVFNAVATSGYEIKTNFTGKDISYSNAKTIKYSEWDGYFANGCVVMGLSTGKSVPLVVVHAADTTRQVFKQAIDVNDKDSFMLFVTGTAAAPEGVLVKQTISVRSDSTTGVRFVNLSPNAGGVSINIKGSSNGSEVEHLQYKSISAYKSYPATYKYNNHIFEVRDVVTGARLLEYNYSELARNRNVTLILRGIRGGTPALRVVRFNN